MCTSPPATRHGQSRSEAYDAVGTAQLLQMECPEVLQTWRRYFEHDDVYDSTGMRDGPRIRRVVAVHGINHKTEVMYALRVNTLRVKPGVLHTRFVFDDEAELLRPQQGRSISGGIIYEEPGGPTPSGDGVVPFDSMEHCRSWAPSVQVKVEHVEGAQHRDLLLHPRFMEVLAEALTPEHSTADVGRILFHEAMSGAAASTACAASGAGSFGAVPGSSHVTSVPASRRWQGSKDLHGEQWWDFPPEVSEQLTVADLAGQAVVEIRMRGETYQVDLGGLMQKNVRTGTSRRVRYIMR